MEPNNAAARKICAALALEGELWNYFTVLLFLFLFDSPLDHIRDLAVQNVAKGIQVFVVIGLPCFILCKVLAEKPL